MYYGTMIPMETQTTFMAPPELLEQVRQRTAKINEPSMAEFIRKCLEAWVAGRLAYKDVIELVELEQVKPELDGEAGR